MASKETLSARVARLEESTQVLIDSQTRTDARLVQLREDMQRDMREINERTDRRIRDLVGANRSGNARC